MKSSELNVSTIFLNRRSNPRLQQFFNHTHYFAVILVVCKTILLRSFLSTFSRFVFYRVDDLLAGKKEFIDDAEHFRFYVRPRRRAVFRDSDVICSEEYGRNTIYI